MEEIKYKLRSFNRCAEEMYGKIHFGTVDLEMNPEVKERFKDILEIKMYRTKDHM